MKTMTTKKSWQDFWTIVWALFIGIGGGIAVLATVLYHNPIVAQMGLVYLLFGWTGALWIELRQLQQRVRDNENWRSHLAEKPKHKERVPL